MKFLNNFVLVAGSGLCAHTYIQLVLISKKTSELKVRFLGLWSSLWSPSSKVYTVQRNIVNITAGKNLVGTDHSRDDDEVKVKFCEKKSYIVFWSMKEPVQLMYIQLVMLFWGFQCFCDGVSMPGQGGFFYHGKTATRPPSPLRDEPEGLILG